VDANFARLALRGERAATLATPTPYPSALAKVFADAFRENGGTVVATASFDVGASPAAAVAEVAAAGPDIVFVPVQGVQACNDTIGALRAEARLAAARIITADGCQSAGTLDALKGRPGPPVFASGPDSSAVQGNAFYAQEFLPAYTALYGTAPTSVWHPNAFDAASMLFDAVRRAARIQDDGSIVILKRALMRALYETDGYDGLSGVLECRSTGDCAQSARISLYAAPAWPVSGGDPNAKAVFTQKVTLADALSG
jgi:ABC-type branched-subunit amino acid transport system substrate-binding protein